MKKNILAVLVAVFIITQIVSIMKIDNLQKQVEYTKNEINNLKISMRNEISSIYQSVDDRLNQEASLIANASAGMGIPNEGNLTVPITFSVTPKEVSANTAVSLDFGGELYLMDKNGTTFNATVSLDIFGSVHPMIVIDENGVKKTMQDDRINIVSMKHLLFPEIFPRFAGEGSYGGGVYKRKGTLTVDIKPSSSKTVFTQMRLVVKVDDEVFSDEAVPDGVFELEIDKSIPLRNGQTCTMTVIATDSIGLEHRCLIGHYTAGSNAQREPQFDYEEIYSSDGKLLWKPE